MSSATDALRNRVRTSIARSAKALRELAGQVHRNPELGFQEKKACAWQLKLLKKWGFKVRLPFAGLQTAYKAVRGKGVPVFCFIAEYDALPEIGHACGHNLICAAAIGAGRALAELLEADGLPGTVVVLGTPAEESKGGKVIMIDNGALEDIDAAIEAHPSTRTTPDTGCTAIRRVAATFAGKAAHAAGSPELGRNALDAVMLLFAGVNAWRQHVIESDRIHGIVSDGGVVPNIVPETASCTFFLRSLDDAQLTRMIRRFRDIAKGAALMTGTKLELDEGSRGYKSRRPNPALNEAFVSAAGEAGLRPVIPERGGRGSSDFGDVSHVVPGVHVYFGISKKVIAAHSNAFREAAGSKYAQEQMLRAAEALAVVGYRFMTDEGFRRRVSAGFRKRR